MERGGGRRKVRRRAGDRRRERSERNEMDEKIDAGEYIGMERKGNRW